MRIIALLSLVTLVFSSDIQRVNDREHGIAYLLVGDMEIGTDANVVQITGNNPDIKFVSGMLMALRDKWTGTVKIVKYTSDASIMRVFTQFIGSPGRGNVYVISVNNEGANQVFSVVSSELWRE
jgi:hypothetical protein